MIHHPRVPAVASFPFFAFFVVLLGLPGCLFTDVRTPLSYGSATPGDAGGSLGKEVKGSACNHAVLWLIAFGDAGYDAAVRNARASTNAQYLVDVKADTDYQNVLFGVYQTQCTYITARIPAPTPAAQAPASPPGAQGAPL